jgi:uncharacterized protein YbaP (TraB family)
VKKRGVLALLFVGAFFFWGVGHAVAAPALWVVQSPTAKVYLFGTIHVLRADTQWRSPELEAAIKDSQDLYLEIADANNAKEGAAAILKVGLDREHPLSSKISKADVTLLDKAAKQMGLPGEVVFEPMRPWLAYMTLSMTPISRLGYAPASGVDLQIRKEFADAGKPVRGFETFDTQAHIFADMPERQQVAMLENELKNLGKQSTAAELNGLVAAWLSGDQDKLTTAGGYDKMRQSPEYPAMIANRNKAWAAVLSQRLKQPGTSFVAVGAAHMLGPDGVPALLQQMGFTVTRVQIASPSPSASSSPSPASTATSQPTAAPTMTITPVPSPAPTVAPKPPTLVAPKGWVTRKVSFSGSGFTSDTMLLDPKKQGAVIAGHLDSQTGALDLDSLDAFFHQGLIAAAGASHVQPSKHVKLCSGKQNGIYTKVTLGKIKEDIVLALSDRAYVAEYVRNAGVKDDPAAIKSLLTLCAP